MWVFESISHDPRFSQATWTHPCCLPATDAAIGPRPIRGGVPRSTFLGLHTGRPIIHKATCHALFGCCESGRTIPHEKLHYSQYLTLRIPHLEFAGKLGRARSVLGVTKFRNAGITHIPRWMPACTFCSFPIFPTVCEKSMAEVLPTSWLRRDAIAETSSVNILASRLARDNET